MHVHANLGCKVQHAAMHGQQDSCSRVAERNAWLPAEAHAHWILLHGQASKVAQHLEKVGQATGAAPFVWTKKVEKELHQGKKLKDISIFSDANRVAERLVG